MYYVLCGGERNKTHVQLSSMEKFTFQFFYAVKVCLHFQLESRDLVQQVLDK